MAVAVGTGLAATGAASVFFLCDRFGAGDSEGDVAAAGEGLAGAVVVSAFLRDRFGAGDAEGAAAGEGLATAVVSAFLRDRFFGSGVAAVDEAAAVSEEAGEASVFAVAFL